MLSRVDPHTLDAVHIPPNSVHWPTGELVHRARSIEIVACSTGAQAVSCRFRVMKTRHTLLSFLLVAATLMGSAGVEASEFREYVLGPGSSISQACRSCATPPAVPEPLSGSFSVALLPLPGMYEAAAITELRLSSPGYQIHGNGFLQRVGADRQAMALQVEVNGEPVTLRSGRRQLSDPGEIRIVLSSASNADKIFILILVAQPVSDPRPDADSDSVDDDSDNCPGTSNAEQSDGDGDRIGDACDACADTAQGEPILQTGCSIEQVCPCTGPVEGGEWQNQRQYLRCVAAATRRLRKQGQVSRQESMNLLRRAMQSGCGRIVVASL